MRCPRFAFALLCVTALSPAVAKETAEHSAFKRFQIAGTPAPVYYYASHRIEDGSRCETAAVMIHGWGGGFALGRAEEPFAAALAKAAGPSNVAPYVIAPLFPRKRLLVKKGIKDNGRAIWNESWGVDLSRHGLPDDDWRGGGDAAGVKLSSFEVVDAILLALGDKQRYPALKRVLVTGFSAGGQFVGRYVAVGKGFVREGVEVRYAAMAPSTELRLDDDVIWHYGLKGRPRYSAQLTREQILKNLSSRRVWRACGTKDVLGKSLDVCPEAMKQGENRYARFRSLEAYLKQFPTWERQVSFHAIEGVGHESIVAHTEKVFIDYALGVSAQGTKTSGAFEKLPTFFDGKTPVVVETKAFKLVINPDATARSLVIKATGEEMLEPREGIPVFATTQTRPFNNEIRLVQQAKRTTYPANRVRREGDLIYIGFETAPYEVAVRVEETAAGYVTFRPERLISNTEQEHQYWHWKMDVPPVDSFRLLQLPVKDRENFGDWLNVMWDGRGCVGVMGGTPYMDVDNERRWGFRKLTVEALKDYGITNGVAVLAAAATPAEFLDQVDAAEAAAGIPRGVQSRRDSRLNASLYWTADIRPENLDEHIAYAKAGGFRMMLIYYTALVNGGRRGYRTLPDYSWGNGWSRESFTAAVRKLNAADITVGFHTLQTFIGFDSSYVTPEADHRLALVKHYTLAKPLPATEAPCDVYVEQNPVAAPLHPKCRILKFGTELMEYTGYVTERPYRFTGVKRRHLGTYAKEHPLGEIGGVLGVSECAAISSYIDQDTSLQDEIGDKIADIYDCGIEFLYFDGSEDANPPCTVNISLSQIRCAARCAVRSGRPPLFTEGCAKSHFGWHLQSGANAFDVFSPEMFKRKIIEYPYAAAQRLAKDFTRVDFGWWRFGPPVLAGPVPSNEGLWSTAARTVGVQPDIWEYGTSKAAAFDCPATMQMKLERLREHRRTADILETVRRWEDVRARKWLTPEQKNMLKDPNREFHLYLPPSTPQTSQTSQTSSTPQTPQTSQTSPNYELVEWKQLDVAGGKWTDVRAFLFERNGKRVVAYWHTRDSARLVFAQPLDGTAALDAANMKYFETALSAETVRAAFASATLHPLPSANGQPPSPILPER